MRILIIDKDPLAIEHLEKLLKQTTGEKKIIGRYTTVAGTINWLQSHKLPDLIFASVELPDGLSFEIFRKLEGRVPVIFTCRHENYAIDAFKANGIYYLIKPIKLEELKAALEKYELNYSDRYYQKKNDLPAHHQERFLVSVGQQLKLIKAEDVAYFYTENKIVYLVCFDSVKYVTEFTLEKLEQLLNPAMFFRINRQYIINLSAIVKMTHASKSRLQVFLRPNTDHSTITSFGRTDNFCRWMLGELHNAAPRGLLSRSHEMK
jgi:two-component system, LytTR family, response regulator